MNKLLRDGLDDFGGGDNPTPIKKDKRNNTVNVLYPYRTKGNTWVYDDLDIPVVGEAFVMGSSELIDMLVGKEANSFTMYISAKPLPSPFIAIDNIDESMDEELVGIKGWYQERETGHKHWLCSQVSQYFIDPYPKTIFVKIDNIKS